MGRQGRVQTMKTLPLWVHICTSVINKLCASLITFLNFGLYQCLIVQNVAGLFSFNSNISDSCCINELSRKSIWGSKILTAILLWRHVMSINLKTQWSRWPQERNAERIAPTIACHVHSTALLASRKCQPIQSVTSPRTDFEMHACM